MRDAEVFGGGGFVAAEGGEVGGDEPADFFRGFGVLHGVLCGGVHGFFLCG